jgi:transposase
MSLLVISCGGYHEYIREEVEFIPAHLKVRKIYRHAYECPCCKKDGADAIVKAELPRPVIPKSLASASSVAWLLHQKYEMSLPFHRQEKEWQNYGIVSAKLNRQKRHRSPQSRCLILKLGDTSRRIPVPGRMG